MNAHPTIPNAFWDYAAPFLFDSLGRLYEVHLSRKLFHAQPLNANCKAIKAPTFAKLAALVAKI